MRRVLASYRSISNARQSGAGTGIDLPRRVPRVEPSLSRAMTIQCIVMPHGLDHIVHAVRDLDAAAELYRRLGFTVGAPNKHPWGTHNRIVQLPGFFIELLTVAEPERL